MSTIPIILAGDTEQVGQTFQEAAKPDVDVVYFATNPQAALADISLVLKGQIPTPANKVGSGDLSHGPPRAVVLGGGVAYDDAFVAQLRKDNAAAGEVVPVLKLEHTAGAGTGVGVGVGVKPTAEQTRAVAERAVKVLKKLEEEGKLDGGDDGVYAY